MNKLEKKLREEHGEELTFEDIIEILEAEAYGDVSNPYNPYKPLNFHDDDG